MKTEEKELEALDRAIDLIFDAAETIRRAAGPVRWCLAEADSSNGRPSRIVLETPMPPVWRFRVGEVIDQGRTRFASREDIEEVDPERIVEWEASERLYLSAYHAKDGPESPTFIDLVTSDRRYAEWFEGLYRDPDDSHRGRFRTRKQMLEENLTLRKALKDWEAGNDWLLAERCLKWADSVAAGPSRPAAKAQLRWTDVLDASDG